MRKNNVLRAVAALTTLSFLMVTDAFTEEVLRHSVLRAVESGRIEFQDDLKATDEHIIEAGDVLRIYVYPELAIGDKSWYDKGLYVDSKGKIFSCFTRISL